MLTALLLASVLQEPKYENTDYGIRLRIPPGWNIDGARQARVILKITSGGEYLVRPEILVYEIPFSEPITLMQYKELVRHNIQRTYKDPLMLDDRQGEAGGRAGFFLEVRSKGTTDADVVSIKGVFQRSPRRMIGVDGFFPAGKEGELRKIYDGILASLEFIPRKKPDGLDAGVKDIQDALKSRPGPAAPPAAVQELGIFTGDKQVGTYRVEIRQAAGGEELSTRTKIDLGEDGRVDTSVTGFLSNDLATQNVEVVEIKVSKDKRTQNFSAKVALAAGEVTAERRINGEPYAARFPAPHGTVLAELLELLQARLVGPQKKLFLLPMAAAYDDETGLAKIELGGLHKMKEGETTSEVFVSHLVRDEGAVMTYWHGADRQLQRVSAANQSFVIRRLK
ncbi:MAG TPA: hypothetical protein VF950_18355 [Planctomycetota bacterium]